MDGFLIQDCTRYPFKVSVISISNGVYMKGKDAMGDFTLIGQVSGSDALLSKLYKKTDSIPIAYKGTISGQIIQGRWFIENQGYTLYNEFAMFPESSAYTQTVDLYGTGAACKYSANWTGSLTINGGDKAEGTLTGLSVSEGGILNAKG